MEDDEENKKKKEDKRKKEKQDRERQHTDDEEEKDDKEEDDDGSKQEVRCYFSSGCYYYPRYSVTYPIFVTLIREYVFIESAGRRCRRGAQGREDGSRQKGELRGAAEQTGRQEVHQAEVSALRPSQRDV